MDDIIPRKNLKYKIPLQIFVEELNILGLEDMLGEIVKFDIEI